jgi:hypothetical protein
MEYAYQKFFSQITFSFHIQKEEYSQQIGAINHELGSLSEESVGTGTMSW